MAEEDRSQQDGPPAWFIIDGSSEDEFFPQQAVAPIPPQARAPERESPQAPPRETLVLAVPAAELVPQPTIPLETEAGASEELRDTPPVDAANPQSGVRPQPEPKVDSEPAPCAPEPKVLDEVSQPAPIPAPPALPPATPLGFRRAELIRVGGADATQPLDRTGFLVVAQTPQPVRLGQILPLKGARNVLGRGSGLGCFLDDPAAVELHAVITYQRQKNNVGFFLHSSTAAVRLNGVPASDETRLASNDRITIGNTELVFLEVRFTREGE